jgi:hypothetical protein
MKKRFLIWKTITLVDENGNEVVIDREKDNASMWGWEWSNEDSMSSDSGISLSTKTEDIEIS